MGQNALERGFHSELWVVLGCGHELWYSDYVLLELALSTVVVEGQSQR